LNTLFRPHQILLELASNHRAIPAIRHIPKHPLGRQKTVSARFGILAGLNGSAAGYEGRTRPEGCAEAGSGGWTGSGGGEGEAPVLWVHWGVSSCW
jgi:hypothetical protein